VTGERGPARTRARGTSARDGQQGARARAWSARPRVLGGRAGSRRPGPGGRGVEGAGANRAASRAWSRSRALMGVGRRST
jgi:hypothetical protein